MNIKLTAEDIELIARALRALEDGPWTSSTPRELAIKQRINQILEKLEKDEAK